MINIPSLLTVPVDHDHGVKRWLEAVTTSSSSSSSPSSSSPSPSSSSPLLYTQSNGVLNDTADNGGNKRRRIIGDSGGTTAAPIELSSEQLHYSTSNSLPTGGDVWQQVHLPCETTVSNSVHNFEMIHADYDIPDELLDFTLSSLKQEMRSPPNISDIKLVEGCNDSADYANKRTSVSHLVPSSTLNFYVAENKTNNNNSVVIQQHSCEIDAGTTNSPASTDGSNGPTSPDLQDDYFRFQYVLCAATSIAMKINEETLTYLNQGQPYEVKLKKLGDLANIKGKVFKSIIRVLFHDRRLQYMEKEQINNWQTSRPGDRLLEIDLPLSYGICECVQEPSAINAVQFLWDPTKEVGVYIKVNCISTEFTAKKHGGEKGVSFRLQIDTYLQEKTTHALHSGSCQIKVFKLKGAERKHKQDREKILKKSATEQSQYQQSYDCTVLSDVWSGGESLPSPTIVKPSESLTAPQDNPANLSEGARKGAAADNAVSSNHQLNGYSKEILTRSSSESDIQLWLQNNRFSSYVHLFENFTAADMFNLSRNDLIDMCGFPSGIRLFNLLHTSPRLTVYIEIEVSSNEYHPVYLRSLTYQEFVSNIAPLVGVTPSQVQCTYVLGPKNTNIIVTDRFVQNIKDETLYSLHVTRDTKTNFKLLLKPSTGTSSPLQT